MQRTLFNIEFFNFYMNNFLLMHKLSFHVIKLKTGNVKLRLNEDYIYKCLAISHKLTP